MTDGFDSDGMPSGWKGGPSLVSKSKFHDIVVDDFLRVVRWAQGDPTHLMGQGQDFRAVENLDSAAARKFQSGLHYRLRELIRDARIFEIVPDLFIRIDSEVDKYVTEELAGLVHKPTVYKDTPWGKVAQRSEISGEELAKYSITCRRQSAEIGVPNPRPFDVMWFGMGSMICLSSRLLAIQENTLLRAGEKIIKAPAIVGIIISDDFCCEINTCTLNMRGEEYESIMLIPVWSNDMWLSPGLGHPWTLNAIMEILNQQDTLVMEQPIIDKRKFSQRRWWQQQMKKREITGKITVIPPMYYTVTIKPTTYTEKTKLAMQSARNWTHRWDVRGHPRRKLLLARSRCIRWCAEVCLRVATR